MIVIFMCAVQIVGIEEIGEVKREGRRYCLKGSIGEKEWVGK
jgi:hypothetical protein